MTQRAFETRPSALAPGRYLERLSKALPGKNWSRSSREFWPEGAKLVISISLQFDVGPPLPRNPPASPLDEGLVCATSRDYGFKEGIPRLLEIFRRRHISATVQMASAGVECHPQLARQIVESGHEPALLAPRSSAQFTPTPDEEKKMCESALNIVQRVSGIRPVGFGGSERRRTSDRLEILQDLGFIYHTDDGSRDEPFLMAIRHEPFVVIPCASELSDGVAYEQRSFSTDQYAAELKNEFEMLYSESESRRRLMSISLQPHISGRPARAKVLEEFIIYAQRRPGVAFMRKEDIARFAVTSALTPREEVLSKGREAA